MWLYDHCLLNVTMVFSPIHSLWNKTNADTVLLTFL